MFGLNKEEKKTLSWASIWTDLGSACSTTRLPFTTQLTAIEHGKRRGNDTARWPPAEQQPARLLTC